MLVEHKLAVSINIAFGLAFDIEKAPECKSGFRPAPFDLGAGKELFGSLRLDGFAALLRIGFAKQLVVVGGNEGRYKDEAIMINRAWAIREMLVHDLGINAEQVSNIASNSNTGGNIAAIATKIKSQGLTWHDCAIVSNLYHLPRIYLDLALAELPILAYPAEAFWLLEDANRKNDLIERLEGRPIAERMAEELQGITDKLRGIYKPRTDAPVLKVPDRHQKQD